MTKHAGIVGVWLLAALLAAGCMVMTSSVDVLDQLGDAQIEKIEDGATTRREVLEWFGPPAALLRPGKETRVQGRFGEDLLTFDEQFLLFTDRHGPKSTWAVFFYQQWASKASGAVVIAVGTNKTTVLRRRLWVLVDEATGTVGGHVFRQD